MTDDSVPEGHKGLHGFLYGEGGSEDEHVADGGYAFRAGEDDGSSLLPVGPYLESRDGEKPVGVYALFDSRRHLQYVGYSRNIVLAVKSHLAAVGEERAAFVRPMVFMNKAMTTREAMAREAANWIDAEGTIPPGNGVEQHLWEASSAAAKAGGSSMSAAETDEYETKKLKLRKAMGENLSDDVAGESPDAKQRRLRMIKAVEGDDWSAVIDEQTKDALPPSSEAAATTADPISSPFSRAQVHRRIGNEVRGSNEMTMQSVDAALDEVRPYLIADGGNVEVASVEAGTVFVRLQGACGSCPASTATMKMGIERSLKAHFGQALREVVEVDRTETVANVAAVDEHLNVLRPAIEGYGGKVEVQAVDDGVCEIRFLGPKPIGMGIRAAIKDKFPDVKEVVLKDWE